MDAKVDELMEAMLESFRKPLPPECVRLGETTMLLRGNKYWRPAGAWGVEFKWVDGVLLSVFPDMPDLHEQPLITVTWAEFMVENEPYMRGERR